MQRVAPHEACMMCGTCSMYDRVVVTLDGHDTTDDDTSCETSPVQYEKRYLPGKSLLVVNH
jgi:hypothetical protein